MPEGVYFSITGGMKPSFLPHAVLSLLQHQVSIFPYRINGYGVGFIIFAEQLQLKDGLLQGGCYGTDTD